LRRPANKLVKNLKKQLSNKAKKAFFGTAWAELKAGHTIPSRNKNENNRKSKKQKQLRVKHKMKGH